MNPFKKKTSYLIECKFSTLFEKYDRAIDQLNGQPKKLKTDMRVQREFTISKIIYIVTNLYFWSAFYVGYTYINPQARQVKI